MVYLVVLPLLELTDWHRRPVFGILPLFLDFIKYSRPIFFLPQSAQRFYMGCLPGLCDSHAKTSVLVCVMYCFTSREVYFGSLQYLNIRIIGIFSKINGSRSFSMIRQYRCWSILPIIVCNWTNSMPKKKISSKMTTPHPSQTVFILDRGSCGLLIGYVYERTIFHQ